MNENKTIIENLQKIKEYAQAIKETVTQGLSRDLVKPPWNVLINAEAEGIRLRADMLRTEIEAGQAPKQAPAPDAGNWYGNDLLTDDQCEDLREKLKFAISEAEKLYKEREKPSELTLKAIDRNEWSSLDQLISDKEEVILSAVKIIRDVSHSGVMKPGFIFEFQLPDQTVKKAFVKFNTMDGIIGFIKGIHFRWLQEDQNSTLNN